MNKTGLITLLATASIIATLLAGCATTAPGGMVTEEKDFTDFTRVEVDGTFDIRITRSEEYSITLTSDKSFSDYIAVTRKGETLKIYLNPRHTFTDFTLQARTLKAEITMPALRGLSLSGASKGTITGFKSEEDFSLIVSGASSLSMDDIETGNAQFEISGASKVTGKLNASDIVFEVSGASGVRLDGSANNISADASGASTLNLANFPLNNAHLKLDGASEASINLSGRLDCFLNSASRLYFQGNPVMGNISVTGASTIKHQ